MESGKLVPERAWSSISVLTADRDRDCNVSKTRLSVQIRQFLNDGYFIRIFRLSPSDALKNASVES